MVGDWTCVGGGGEVRALAMGVSPGDFKKW